MSKSLTVLLTASRSSARRAPISYTPPVKPPPPRTRAVFEGRFRLFPRLRREVESMSTTFPINTDYLTRLGHRRPLLSGARVLVAEMRRGLILAAILVAV